VKVDTSGATDVVLVATDIGLFRSTDAGASYVLSDVGQATGKNAAWSIVRTSAGWLLSAADVNFLSGAATDGAMFISSDRGATWSPIPNTGGVYSYVGRSTLAVAAPGDRVVYALASDPYGFDQGDLYRSDDGGLNWRAIGLGGKTPTNPNCFQPGMNVLNGQAYYNQLITVSGADSSRNTVYIGGNLSTAKTADGGGTWTLTSSWLPRACDDGITPNLPYVHADSHAAVTTMVGNKEHVIFGTDGGIFISKDGGKSFDSSKNRGIVSLLTQTIISTPRRADSAISGLQDTGTRARFKGSDTWNQVFGGDGEGVGWSQANNAVTLASTYDSFIVTRPGLPANTGDPNDWQDGTTGINFNDPDCFPFFTPIATPTASADPTGQVFFTATGSRIYKTTNGAQSWQPLVQFGSTAAPICYVRARWHAIGLHPRDTTKIAVTGVGGRVLISTNAGTSWSIKRLTGLLPGWQGFNSVAAWNDVGTLFIASESPIPGSSRFASSKDNGATWALGGAGLPDVAISDVVVDPHDRSGNTLYAGTWIGVYVSRDAGANWTLFGAGLPNVSVTGLYISPLEKFLRVAAYGRGVWEIDLDKR
jgi:photosystem II stability/assembly factor-like uncharacterized protein